MKHTVILCIAGIASSLHLVIDDQITDPLL